MWAEQGALLRGLYRSTSLQWASGPRRTSSGLQIQMFRLHARQHNLQHPPIPPTAVWLVRRLLFRLRLLKSARFRLLRPSVGETSLCQLHVQKAATWVERGALHRLLSPK